MTILTLVCLVTGVQERQRFEESSGESVIDGKFIPDAERRGHHPLPHLPPGPSELHL